MQEAVRRICEELRLDSASRSRRAGLIIPALRRIQDEFGRIPPDAITEIADCMEVAESDIYSVITFYSWFGAEPER